MRVLITGAFGWTAASIVKALKQAGHEITAFDLPTAACSHQTKALFSEIVLGTVADSAAVQRATQSVDSIIHLAIASGEDAYQRPGAQRRGS